MLIYAESAAMSRGMSQRFVAETLQKMSLGAAGIVLLIMGILHGYSYIGID